jgi:PAS domain S-box-containing protein
MSVEWHFLVTLNDRLRSLRSPVEIQDVALRLLGEHLHASRVHFAEIEGDEFIIRRAYTRTAGPLLGRGDVAHFGKAIVNAFRRGETVAISDVQTDPRLTHVERAQFLGSEIASLVGVPLTKGGRWVATFAVHIPTRRSWTRDQISLVEVTAERTWAAGARGLAEEALNRRNDRQAFLRTLTDTIRPLADPARILDETCRLLGTHLEVHRVSYGEIDGGDCTIANDYVNGLPSQAGRFRWVDMAGSRTQEILQGGTLFVNDTSLEPHTAAERETLHAAGIRAYICPILVKDGRFVAAFGVHSREPRVWTPDEILLVEDVADRIWATLEHLKAEAELRANEERLAFLLRLNDALRPLSDPGDVQDTAARLLGEHLGTARVTYSELHGDHYGIYREYARGVASHTGEHGQIMVDGPLREAFRRGETVVVNDVQTEPRLTDESRAKLHSRQVGAFIWTMLQKGGLMIAAFGTSDAAPRVWTASEVELVRDVAERTWEAVERTRAEAALHEQKHRLRVALEASAGGSWMWVAATNQVDWDEQFRSLYGFAADEPATPEAWVTRVHPDDRARLLALREQMWTSKTQDSWESTFRIVRPDGTVAWIQSRGRVDRDSDGNVTRLAGLDLDFNHHHETEEALQARRHEEYNRALRTLLETATQGIVSIDEQGVIDSTNHAFDAMFGWAAGDLIGQRIERLMPSAFRDGYERRGVLNLVGVHRNGSAFPIEVSVNHVPRPGGGRAFAFVTDVTDRQRAESALQQRTAELEYRTIQLSRMASDLTLAEQHAREEIAKTLHDGLQQLLVIAALNLEQQLKRDGESGAAPSELLSEAKYQLEEAIAAARSLNVELFPPVLQHSGLPAALQWLAKWTHDKYKLDVRVLADPRADSERKDVRTLLFASVRELVFNAVKHAQADRVTLELALEANDQLCITVSDRGIGFEPSTLEQRSAEGPVGWGLFSIRERLTLLGGRFEIESAPGSGTRVRLVAPRGNPHGSAAAGPAAVSGPTVPASAGYGPTGPVSATGNGHGSEALRILIVDDHAVVRSALRGVLDDRPQLAVVGDASDGVEAIARAHALRPDVILMDIAMPRMDGIEATVRIRAELPDIRILGLSMHPRSAAADAIEQAGAEGFFVKGIDTHRLIDHLLAVHAVARCPPSPEAAAPVRPRVLLADDDPGVVKALERVLSFDCDIVEVVDDGSKVAEAARRLQPIVTVVDLNLPDMSGLEVCRRILRANPRAKVIVITAMIDDGIRAEALAAGAAAFVSKLMAGNELIDAIRGAWTECSSSPMLSR